MWTNADKRRFRKRNRLESDQLPLPKADGSHHPLGQDTPTLLRIKLQHSTVGDLLRVVALDLEEHWVLDLVLNEDVERTRGQDD